MLARIQKLVVFAGYQTFVGEEGDRRHIARVGRGRCMRDFFAFQIGELLERAVFLDDEDEVIALEAIGGTLDREGYRACQVDGKVGGAGGKAAHVQPVRTHGFDFGRIALHLIEDDFAVYAFGRSEEHTSELQSLMRISYAVFCLKKKQTKTKSLIPQYDNDSY